MSKVIHNPTLSNITNNGDNSATFVIEPLHSGYGTTLGNSLRRVLLSSIEGAAITAFKVEGATHEFTTLPGVKEDIVDIMLNLKNIKFRNIGDEPVELTISKKGSGAVTANDIKTTGDIEVVNPKALVATIDDPKVTLTIDIVVESGRGYRTIEEASSTRLHSDMIALDAIFSPVSRVRYNVESTRVGQITDLDKLNLTVETDGSLSPQEAFEQAAAILINQYTALAGSTRVEVGETLASADLGDGSELNTSIEDLNLSARTANALINNDIRKVQDLVSLGEIELRELKGFGSRALDEVKDKLVELEL